MDKIWGFITMPLGVTLCFGPAMLVWWLTKDKSPAQDKAKDSH